MANDGRKLLFLFGFYFVNIVFFLYIAMQPTLLHCKLSKKILVFILNSLITIAVPLQIKLLRREHFNRWYSIDVYFLAHFASNMPIQMVFGFFYVLIVYFMTSQPLDIERFALFYMFCMLSSFTAESFGMMISSVMNVSVKF